VNLDDLRWDRPDLDCEPQQAEGSPRNLQLDETAAVVPAALAAICVGEWQSGLDAAEAVEGLSVALWPLLR
jgi:hypothetical protein